MEIVLKLSRSGETKLSQIQNGVMFKLPKGETVYIKIWNPHRGHPSCEEHTYSVVNLKNGIYYDFTDRTVVVMDGTLTAWEVY